MFEETLKGYARLMILSIASNNSSLLNGSMKLLYWIGIFYIVICVLFTARQVFPFPFSKTAPSSTSVIIAGGSEWFKTIRPYCNPVEVEAYLVKIPPPDNAEGAGYAAACLALANKIDRARVVILDLPENERYQASQILFSIGHPIADAGDNQSSAPIMRLVLEFDPNNIEALYHAGTSEYALGDFPKAKKHLSRFSELYKKKDMMSNTAYDILNHLE
jgi:tetratricopeptide (TPR) repeat protein